MTPDELTSLINRRLMEEATGPETRPAVFHVKDEKLHGIGVAHLPRGEAHDTSKASHIYNKVTIVSDWLDGQPGIPTAAERERQRLAPITEAFAQAGLAVGDFADFWRWQKQQVN